ncbi:phase-specific protein [Pochonia chlamydosporia 170]|uniref:Phase-specific protein n=1 Tax=Pochonia chlamydosporia 170 TaxID=1380566 RepID=A0A179F7F3_METCM|nr:phase-specific protein [Pochonia chlamydosporia 170]OAQ61260.1 phase-specific protein [Pochonia chlamydosporia 170]
MLGQTTLLAATLALAGAVSAVGNAVVKNNCNFDVTVWSVGSEISAPNTLRKGQSYSEQFSRDPKTGGRALKVTREPDGLFTGKPQTIFAYNLNGGRIWYDLSDVFGDAFAGHKLVEGSADTSCPSIVWPNGTPPAGSQVKNCRDSADVTLTLCSK